LKNKESNFGFSVLTTLTTVGYGDIKGYTSEEYGFTMGVEFVGILFFSIMMSFTPSLFQRSSYFI
jgi:hypothetical protein